MRINYTLKLLTIILFSYSGLLNAQIWLDDASIYNEAQEFLDGEEFEEALPLFTLLEKKEITNSNINYHIGKCYLNIVGKKAKSIPYLEAAVENVSVNFKNKFTETKAPAEAHLLLGIAYRINNQFDKAIKEFSTYKNVVSTSDSEILADYHISVCNTARTMLNFPNNSSIEALNISENYPVYNPLYTSSGSSFFMEVRPFYDAIITGESENQNIINRINLSPEIKSDGEHTFINSSTDGKKIILKAYDTENGYELYYATLDERGKWSKYAKFPEPVNSPQNEVFATFSGDGKDLFFCSNRTGGNGGTDIYVSRLQNDGNWGNPTNLGPLVNSTFDETTVFLSADENKLFFSSEGHVNMGGTDYFVSERLEDGAWSKPTNLGSPVSTTDDDEYLSPTKAENVFYTHKFDHENDNKYKVFKVVLDEEALLKKVLLKGQLEFTDEVPEKDVAYKVFKNDAEKYTSSTDENGAYSFILPPGQYNITYEYNENIHSSQTLTIDEALAIDELNLEAPEWVFETQEEPSEDRPQVVVTIKPVLFAFDNYSIPDKYHPYLDSICTFVKEHEMVQINIIGHTDAIGSPEYNKKLSERRATSVEKYFVDNGLSASRIKVKGLGEEKPVAVNAIADGRKYNRRVRINLINTESDIVINFIDIVPEALKVK